MAELATAPAAGFEHSAAFYADEGEYADAVLAFVGAGLDDGDRVFVAVPGPKLRLLRDRLGGRAGQVTFADMAELGANPAWIIPRVREFLDASPGQPVRYVGEPIWATRTAAELCEATRHEALLNLAFAGAPVNILCPYDTARLGQGVIANAERTHPVVIRGGHPRPSPGYAEAATFPADCDLPLPPPPRHAAVLAYAEGLGHVRAFAEDHARAAGLSASRATDLVIAVHELAANTLRHTSSQGILRIWASGPEAAGGPEVICQIQDSGQVSDPLVGRRRPAAEAGHGHGLWAVHQLCDLVELRTGHGGTTVRLHMRLSA
jgi:anti-sigma regulatory factor (Ser/Thr protein kinase)